MSSTSNTDHPHQTPLKGSVSHYEDTSEQEGMDQERDLGCLIALIVIILTVSLISIGMAIKEDLLKWVGVSSFWILILIMRIRIRLNQDS